MIKFNNFRVVILILLTILLVVFLIIKLWENKRLFQKTPLRYDVQVILYVKNECGFCILAKELLEKNNIAYEAIDLSFNTQLQQKLIKQTGQTTVPYVFINNKFIGGYTDLLSLKENNKL